MSDYAKAVDKTIRAINDSFHLASQSGGMLLSEYRAALRKAGVPLGPDEDLDLPATAPDMTDYDYSPEYGAEEE